MPFNDLSRPLYEVKAELLKGLSHPIRLLELLEQILHDSSDRRGRIDQLPPYPTQEVPR